MKNYTQQFEKTVLGFCTKGKLLTTHIVVAVSGGVDSMALAFLASKLLEKKIIKRLTILHINHQTRPECASESKMVKRFTKKINAEFMEFKLEGLSLDDKSFEQNARNRRQEIFQIVQSQQKVKIWCAHHLDDSFEWSLKQRFSSSVYRRQYGIPYRTPLIVRPFMSVSKEQLVKYALENRLKWKDDSSNLDTRFERGYLRQVLIPSIKKKYPQYLKHYVRQMEVEQARYILNKRENFHSYLCWPHSPVPKQLIKRSISSFSSKSRGKLTDQVQKIENMLQNGKPGPMDMSGGVKVYNLSHELIITTSEYVTQFKAASFQLEESQYHDAQSLKQAIKDSKSTLASLWVALDDELNLPAFKGGHPLLPMNLRNCCDAKEKIIVSSWKALRYLMHNTSKKTKIALIVQFD